MFCKFVPVRPTPELARVTRMVSQILQGVDLPISLPAGLPQRGDKELPIPVIVEDRFPPVAAVHHVVDRAWVSNA